MLTTIRSLAENRYWVSREALSSLIRRVPSGVLLQDAEKRCIALYATKIESLAVEIGTFKGGSASIISKAMPRKARLVTIDPYTISPHEPRRQASQFLAHLNVLKHGNLRRVRFIRGYSYNVVTNWTEPIDWLWIDGNHEYTEAKRDFESWSKFLVPGGYLIFHDSNKPDLDGDDTFDNGHIGPTLVCNEIKRDQADQYEHIEAVLSLNIFRKKE